MSSLYPSPLHHVMHHLYTPSFFCISFGTILTDVTTNLLPFELLTSAAAEGPNTWLWRPLCPIDQRLWPSLQMARYQLFLYSFGMLQYFSVSYLPCNPLSHSPIDIAFWCFTGLSLYMIRWPLVLWNNGKKTQSHYVIFHCYSLIYLLITCPSFCYTSLYSSTCVPMCEPLNVPSSYVAPSYFPLLNLRNYQ